jgi:CheY-like chemotaxis protein
VSKRVLVAEDDSAIRNLLLRVLGRAGFEIEAVTNGRDAIARLTAQPYDGVVLDLMMPEASGFEVLAWVRREKPEVGKKLVVVTAAADRDTRRIAEGEVFAIIRKPFDIADLVTCVRSAAENAA